MGCRKLLQEEGWYLSAEGLETLGFSEDFTDIKGAVKKILDFDLREIGTFGFPEEFCKTGNRSETLEKLVCVQLQKVKNISAPKSNEESRVAPRMLKLIFTDGINSYQGVEVDYINGLSINTPPGSKILIKTGTIHCAHNILFLGPNNIKVLGGHVPHMVEKWELNRSLAKHTRGVGGEGAPPPWIPFGQPLEGLGLQDKSFKSLQDGPKLDNVEFEAQRKGAIAEAQKLSGVKKVFGGGTKPMLDTNVQKIVDAGFTEEQAENILKVTRNNTERALKILQKKEGAVENKKEKNKVASETKSGRKGRGKDGDEEGNTAVKPSGKVSLFDFLEDKLPALPEPEKPTKNPEPQVYHREDRRGGRGGGRGGHRGGGGTGRQNNYHNNKHDNHQSSHSSDMHNKRDDRQLHSHTVQPEKAPRFQKKYENDTRRQHQHQHQQSQLNIHDNISPQFQVYSQQPVQQPHQFYGDRRNVVDNNIRSTSNTRNFYGQQPIDNLADATASMNIQANTQTRIYNNSRPNTNNINQQSYTNTSYNNYTSKLMYNNPSIYTSENYKRNNHQFINNNNKPNNIQQIITNGQQPQMHQAFYNPYHDNQQIKPEPMRQQEIMDAFRQNPMQDQRNNFNNRGNGFYQTNKIISYQNINDQTRKMIHEIGEINWNIGDRCLAKYWEDNGFYDAEITGVSTRTVVVRFLAYGNHEEVLKTDCLPPNTAVPALHNYNSNPNMMMREPNRPTRFHQPMYVPPAQRKA